MIQLDAWTLWINIPPLSMNSREHWARKAEKTKALRTAAYLLAKQQHIPALGKCAVSLTIHPRTNRRRDTDNFVASLKPLCDGLVDAGIVADDHPGFMVKDMPTIGESDTRGLMSLRVRRA